jgi:hypothetical protein
MIELLVGYVMFYSLCIGIPVYLDLTQKVEAEEPKILSKIEDGACYIKGYDY